MSWKWLTLLATCLLLIVVCFSSMAAAQTTPGENGPGFYNYHCPNCGFGYDAPRRALRNSAGSAGGTYTTVMTTKTYGSSGVYSYGSSGGTATPTQVLSAPRPLVAPRLRSLLRNPFTRTQTQYVTVIPESTDDPISESPAAPVDKSKQEQQPLNPDRPPGYKATK